ncbi:MAG: hypothetical protein ACUVTL_09390 [Thermoproteota archaeon]
MYGVEQGCRFVFLAYLIALVMMFTLRQVLLTESKLGVFLSSKGRKEASVLRVGYIEVFKTVAKHKKLLIVFILNTIGAAQYQLATTFQPLERSKGASS